MIIDTKKLREIAERPAVDRSEDPYWRATVLQLCNELDQARADVLKLRSAFHPTNFCVWEGKILRADVIEGVLADTEHYEQYR